MPCARWSGRVRPEAEREKDEQEPEPPWASRSPGLQVVAEPLRLRAFTRLLDERRKRCQPAILFWPSSAGPAPHLLPVWKADWLRYRTGGAFSWVLRRQSSVWRCWPTRSPRVRPRRTTTAARASPPRLGYSILACNDGHYSEGRTSRFVVHYRTPCINPHHTPSTAPWTASRPCAR
jgi:hypothetical protein